MNNPLVRIICLTGLSIVLISCVGSGGGGSAGKSQATNSSPGSASSSAGLTSLIKINQLGFNPNSEKLAVVPDVAATQFRIINRSDNAIVLTGNLSATKSWSPASESVKLADFSAVTTVGDYKIEVDGIAQAANFKITANAYDALNAGSIKAFYYNRSGTQLLETHAGIYKRAAGHPGTQVYIHQSAASANRPAGTVISAPKGWYDAGDYNLYIVNSGISTYTLLAAFEAYPEFFENQNLNIPETGDQVPDLLNEILWNIEWMLAMQDPNDGGVYHKLTSKNFSGFVMPAADTSDRYVVQKATAATLDFAAVMAVASRVFADYESVYPGLSAQMLTAAENAWAWAKANPQIYYSQPSDITTGGYGDNNVTDEFAWAAAELYITTQNNNYYTEMNAANLSADVPGWGNVKSLSWVSLGRNIDSLTTIADKDLIKNRLFSLADTISSSKQASAYAVSMVSGDFVWGSNAVAMNQAMMLLAAYDQDKSKIQYLQAAQSLLDYVLGRNPTDYSFVTGFGSKTPMHIHHRPSAADGIVAPIPGFIAGGPNPGQQDKSDCNQAYPSNLPAKSYLDHDCSYASNEIAINWNAPLVFVSAGVQVNTP